MCEWGLMPDDINENWTEERLALMFMKRNERIRAMNSESKPTEAREPKRVSADEFFQNMNQTVNIVKVGNA